MLSSLLKKFYAEFIAADLQFYLLVLGIQLWGRIDVGILLILNRMMFVYFLKRKGFIDKDLKLHSQNGLDESVYRGRNLFASLQDVFWKFG